MGHCWTCRRAQGTERRNAGWCCTRRATSLEAQAAGSKQLWRHKHWKSSTWSTSSEAALEARATGRPAELMSRSTHIHSSRTDHELEELELVGVAAQLRLVLRQEGVAQSKTFSLPTIGFDR